MAHVQLFLSTVSAEFRSYRDALRRPLTLPNVSVAVQEDFIPTGTETLDKLDDYIQACHAVIHLVGDMTGALAQPSAVASIQVRYPDLADRLPPLRPFLAPGAQPLSYTQWEAYLAIYHGKTLLIASPDIKAPRDARYVLDPVQRCAQQDHLRRLRELGRYPEINFASEDKLAIEILRSGLHDIRLAAGSSGKPVNLPYLSLERGATQIATFVQDYLIKDNVAVPFGGREELLGHLTAWLRDPDAPPNALLCAPAGRGKSATMVHWTLQVAADLPRTRVIFVPVSIRYRLNSQQAVFGALVSRLASFYAEPISLRGASGDEMCELFAGYLVREPPTGNALLVVLDGLDEGAGWDVYPGLFVREPAKGVRVLVTARQTHRRPTTVEWLAALGWDAPDTATCLEVPLLSKAGVEDVLARMDSTRSSALLHNSVVEELFRLTAGDPLLVGLYSDALRRGTGAPKLNVEALRTMKPGLTGYFERWWDDQQTLWGDAFGKKRDEVLVVFNVLAAAFGPFRRRELLELVKRRGAFTGDALDVALLALERFVLQSPPPETTYVLTHPRFASYRFEKLRADGEDREYEALFLDWGERTLGLLRSDAQFVPSPYIVQFYGAHLERARAGEHALLRLVDTAWRDAWEAVQDDYDGFLTDLDRASRAAAASNRDAIERGASAPFLAGQIRCAFFRSVHTGAVATITPAFLAQLMRHGAWSAARVLRFVERLPDSGRRAAALAAIGEHLPAVALDDAVALVDEMANDDALSFHRAIAVAGISSGMAQRGRSSDAQKLLLSLPDDNRAEAIAQTINAFPCAERGILWAALEKHLLSANSGQLFRLLRLLTKGLDYESAASLLNDEPGAVMSRLMAAEWGEPSEWDAQLVTLSLPWLAPSERARRASGYLTALEDQVRGSHNPYTVTRDIVELAPHLDTAHADRAVGLAQGLPYADARIVALAALWHAAPRHRDMIRAEVTNALSNGKWPSASDDFEYFFRITVTQIGWTLIRDAIRSPQMSGWERGRALEAVAPVLERDHLHEALLLAELCEKPLAFDDARGALLARLASFGAKESREAIGIAQVQDEAGIARLVCTAFEHVRRGSLDDEAASDIAQDVLVLRSDAARLSVMDIAVRAATPLQAEAFATLVESHDGQWTAVEAVGRFAPHLAPEAAADPRAQSTVAGVLRAGAHELKARHMAPYFRRLAEARTPSHALEFARAHSATAFVVPIVACLIGTRAFMEDEQYEAAALALARGLNEPINRGTALAAAMPMPGDMHLPSRWREFLVTIAGVEPQVFANHTDIMLGALPTALQSRLMARILRGDLGHGRFLHLEATNRARTFEHLGPYMPLEVFDRLKPELEAADSTTARDMVSATAAVRYAAAGEFGRALQEFRRRAVTPAAAAQVAALMPQEGLPEIVDLAIERLSGEDRLLVWDVLDRRWQGVPAGAVFSAFGRWVSAAAREPLRQGLLDLIGWGSALKRLGDPSTLDDLAAELSATRVASADVPRR